MSDEIFGFQCAFMRFESGTEDTHVYGVQVEITFMPMPVPTGWLGVQEEWQLGATGARCDVRLLAAAGTNGPCAGVVCDWTEDASVRVGHKLKTTASGSVLLKPSVKIKNHGGDEIELSPGSIESKEAAEHEARATLHESSVTAVPYAPSSGPLQGYTGIRWTHRPPRFERIYRQHLEGVWRVGTRLSLPVNFGSTQLQCTVSLTDRRFFGPDGRKLSRIASLGVLIALRMRSAPELPSRGPHRKTYEIVERPRK